MSSTQVSESGRTSQTPCPLSEREMEVLRLLATGASNQQIAKDLSISVNTVKVHIRNIFEKLDVQSRTEATLYAIQEGWVTVGGGPAAPAESPPAEPTEAVAAPAPSKGALLRYVGMAVASMVVILLIGLVWFRPTARPQANQPVIVVTMGPLPRPTLPPRWVKKAPLPTPRSGLAAVGFRGQVYAIAGESPDGITGVVERYDPKKDRWFREADKPTPVRDVGAAVLAGRIYVPGGCAQDRPLDVMEVYDPETNTWATAQPMPIALCAYALAVLEGKLYVIGGWDGEAYSHAVLMYDPEADAWQVRTDMPTARGYAGAGVVDGNIYVVGGYDGRNTLALLEVFDPRKDREGGQAWEKRAPLPIAVRAPGVASILNLLNVLAVGSDGVGRMFQYNVREDTWREFEASPFTLEQQLTLATVGTKLYLVGGTAGAPTDVNVEFTAVYQAFIPVPR